MEGALPVGVFTCDETGALVEFNRKCADIWGLDAGARPQGKFGGAFKCFRPDGRSLPEAEWPMAIALRTGKPVDASELIFERPDGSRVFVETSVEPIFDEHRALIGAVGCIQDITKRKDIEGRLNDERQTHAAFVDAAPECIKLAASDGTLLPDISGRKEDEIQAARLAAIVASSDDAIVSKTLEGIITSWNAGAERIFGYSAEEIIGQHITRIVPVELRAEEEDILARLRRGEHIDHFETVRVGKNGQPIDVSITESPIRDKSGKITGASMVGRDITERKQFERLQQLLVSELNHRVKNTLAMVQAIANQTVHRAKSPGDFAASFSGRLQALARTHTLLTQSTWQGAELLAIARDQLSSSEAEDERISFSGPLVTLNAQAALHLGLVLHELATNAMKYGALSEPRGKLSITWMVRSEGGRHLVLQWQERGGPSVSVPHSRGFGTTLIEKSLHAHGGVTSIRYEAEGVTCEIMLPLPESDAVSGGSYNRLLAIGPEISKATRSYVERKAPTISGKHVLVVDDEPLIAMDIVASLEDEGCHVVGPAATLQKALGLIEHSRIDVALLDANLAGEPVDVLAAALARRKIPFAFVSGYGREGLPEAFRNAELIKKPFQRQRLIDVVQQMLLDTNTVVPLRRNS